MPMQFEFATANRVVFGRGRLKQLGELTRNFGCRPLVVTGSNPDRITKSLDPLIAAGKRPHFFSVSGEPSVQTVMSGLEQARTVGCDWVFAMGGGAALDAGKAIAGLMNNPGDPLNYLEVVGKGLPLRNPSVPLAVAPTTSGTGSEVTRNAVLSVPEKRFKVSLRSPFLLPSLAVVDSEWTHSAPHYVKACSGMDALTQLLEPWVSCKGNWMTDAFCRQGMALFRNAFRSYLEDPENAVAHDKMAMASLLSGLALANSGLGVIHGFAAPLGGMYEAPHGAICARLAAEGTRANILKLETEPESFKERDLTNGLRNPLEQYHEAAQLLLGDPAAKGNDLVAWLEELTEWARIPRLQNLGVKEIEFSEIADKATQSGSMKGNPVDLTQKELMGILKASF